MLDTKCPSCSAFFLLDADADLAEGKSFLCPKCTKKLYVRKGEASLK